MTTNIGQNVAGSGTSSDSGESNPEVVVPGSDWDFNRALPVAEAERLLSRELYAIIADIRAVQERPGCDAGRLASNSDE